MFRDPTFIHPKCEAFKYAKQEEESRLKHPNAFGFKKKSGHRFLEQIPHNHTLNRSILPMEEEEKTPSNQFEWNKVKFLCRKRSHENVMGIERATVSKTAVQFKNQQTKFFNLINS